MSTVETPDLFLHAARDLAIPLWEAQSVAMASAGSACSGLKGEGLACSLFPRAVRYFFAQALMDTSLPDGWEFCVDTSHGCLTELRGFGMMLRYLKENASVHPGGIPSAGRNPARQDYWGNGELIPLPLEELQDPLRLLLLWDVPTGLLGGDFTMRIVHPTGPGSFKAGTPYDLSLDLTLSLDLESRLTFRGDDDDTDFFAHIETEVERAD